MFSAYDALTASMKERIDDMVVLHHYGNRADMDESSRTSAERLTPEQKKRVTNVFHPLVQRHPITGRKSLYGVAGSSFGIVGMPDDEALELLDELKAHATQPRFVTQYDYGVGDVAAWDTYSTLHMATLHDRATTPETRRLLWRVSVTGKAPTYEGPLADKRPRELEGSISRNNSRFCVAGNPGRPTASSTAELLRETPVFHELSEEDRHLFARGSGNTGKVRKSGSSRRIRCATEAYDPHPRWRATAVAADR
jgi:hypothetical protein